MNKPTLPLAADLLIFDLDGTLVDTLEDLTAAINHMLESFGLPPMTPAVARALIGDGTRVFLLRALGPGNEGKIDEALDRYFAYYHSHLTVHTRPYDGVAETLEHFRSKTKVVYTNKDTAPSQQILDELGLARHFDACYGAGDAHPCKPDPAGLFAICERFGIPPGRTVMIGDGDTDVLVARNAGVPVLAATYGFRDREKLEALGPTAFFDSFGELAGMIR